MVICSKPTYMIAWEGFPLYYNLVLFLCRLVKTGHKEMQVRRERFHHSDLIRLCSSNRSHLLCSFIIYVEKWRLIAILMPSKVPIDAFGSPGRQMLRYIVGNAFWLKPKGVSAEVNRLSFLFSCFSILYWRTFTLDEQ